MLTYKDIYEALRKERYSEQLQPLPKKFISQVSQYLKEKKKLTEKETDLFSDTIIKTKKQFENAISIFRELMLRRKKKILNLVFIAAETGISKRDFENMLDFEKELFDKIMKNVEDADKKLMNSLNGKEEEEKSKYKLVVFKQDTPQFIGLEGEPLGPFKKGEFANLPEEIVKILLEDKKVGLIEE